MSPETTSGGRALRFYSSIRIDVRKIDVLKKSGEAYGNRVRTKIVKNKVAPPFTEAEFNIIYGEGIDSIGEIIDAGVETGIVLKAGAWFSLTDGTKIGQGKDKAREYIMNNPELLESLKSQIKEKITPKTVTSDVNEEDDESLLDE